MKKYKYMPYNNILGKYNDLESFFENPTWSSRLNYESFKSFVEEYKADIEKNNWDSIFLRFDIKFGRISVLLMHILWLMQIDVDNEIIPYLSENRLKASVGKNNLTSFYKEVE